MQRQHMPSWCSSTDTLRLKGIVLHLCVLLSSACLVIGDTSALSCGKASCDKEAISGRSLVQVRSGFIFKTEDSPASSLTGSAGQVVSRNNGEASVVQAPSDDSSFMNETAESMLLSHSVLLKRTSESRLQTASAVHNETAEPILARSGILYNATTASVVHNKIVESMLSRGSVLHNQTESAKLTNGLLNNELSKSASIKQGYEGFVPASFVGLLEARQAQNELSWAQQLRIELASQLKSRLGFEEAPRRTKPKSPKKKAEKHFYKGEEIDEKNENTSKGKIEAGLFGVLVVMMLLKIFDVGIFSN